MKKPSTPNVEEQIKQEAISWPDRARSIKITTPDEYGRAAELLKGIKGLQKKTDETFDPIIAKARETVEEAKLRKADVYAPLARAERIIKDGMIAFDLEAERQRREEQKRIDDEARRQADAEALERAAALEREAAAWGDGGLAAEAEQIVEERIQDRTPPPVPLVPRSTPRVAGIARKTTWSGQCVDLAALVRHVAANPADLNLLQANQTAINALARATKSGFSKPGCRAYETPDIAAGSR